MKVARLLGPPWEPFDWLMSQTSDSLFSRRRTIGHQRERPRSDEAFSLHFRGVRRPSRASGPRRTDMVRIWCYCTF